LKWVKNGKTIFENVGMMMVMMGISDKAGRVPAPHVPPLPPNISGEV